MTRIWVIVRILPGPDNPVRTETFVASKPDAIERFKAFQSRCDEPTEIFLYPLGGLVRCGNGTRKLREKP